MLTGHCLCGSVAYEISGKPLAMMYCHCEECRRATGSSLNTSLFVQRADFRIVSGDHALSFHESSPGNRRHFCTRCGSPLFKHFPQPPGLLTVRAGTLDSDPGVRPRGHIWVSEKAPWYEISDGLPQYPKAPPAFVADEQRAERMSDSGQVTSRAAEIYDEFFVPALFGAWPPRLVAAAQLRAGMRVLDVACGTGVLTLSAAKAVSPGGTAVGVDLNSGMLTMARSKAPEIDWREAPAEALPFDSGDFDAAVSQFGLMFFRDRRAAIQEMWRVLRPGGRLAIAVWDSLENTPGYSVVTSLLARLFGSEVAELLRAPYSLGDTELLEALLVDSGVEKPEVARVPGEARFPSVRSWMHTDVRGWTLADKLDDEQFELLVREAERDLGGFVTPESSVRFAHPALIATARKP